MADPALHAGPGPEVRLCHHHPGAGQHRAHPLDHHPTLPGRQPGTPVSGSHLAARTCPLHAAAHGTTTSQGNSEERSTFLKLMQDIVPGANLMSFMTGDDGGYNLCHFWSNFEIGDLNFFRSEAYMRYFDFLDRCPRLRGSGKQPQRSPPCNPVWADMHACHVHAAHATLFGCVHFPAMRAGVEGSSLSAGVMRPCTPWEPPSSSTAARSELSAAALCCLHTLLRGSCAVPVAGGRSSPFSLLTQVHFFQDIGYRHNSMKHCPAVRRNRYVYSHDAPSDASRPARHPPSDGMRHRAAGVTVTQWRLCSSMLPPLGNATSSGMISLPGASKFCRSSSQSRRSAPKRPMSS